MNILMHIAFDNSSRLKGRIYYFEYKGVQFKLIQNNPRAWADVLLALAPVDDRVAQQRVYATAAEFLSALSWENKSCVSVEYVGGVGVPYGYALKQGKCRVFVFPNTPFKGRHVGYGLSRIPEIENDEQRTALTLFREAMSSNKIWLSFLFYWQVLEVGGGNPVAWINKEYYKKRRLFIPNDEIKLLAIGTRKIGDYLLDDCRHAIAHIRRAPCNRAIQLDVQDDNLRMKVSTSIAKSVAENYILLELGLRKKLHLVKLRRNNFPKYVDSLELRHKPYVLIDP